MSEILPRSGWILYDGDCGFCFRWAHFWERVLAKRGFALKDLQSACEDGSLSVSKEQLLDDIWVLTMDGALISGADAYLFVMRRILWAWPIYPLFRLPGFHQAFNAGYRWFNRNRYRVSRHCPLPAKLGRS